MSERTILFDVFATNQKRERLIEEALAETDLPPEDYPLYVFLGTTAPVTPTEVARELGMPLSTLLFRMRRLEERRHVERVPNPDDGRSYLLRLTPAGERLLAWARPLFRARALAVEARLGEERVAALRQALGELGDAIERERGATPESSNPPARQKRSRAPGAM
jgi:DNA-binding MarR family transcriptional regulator